MTPCHCKIQPFVCCTKLIRMHSTNERDNQYIVFKGITKILNNISQRFLCLFCNKVTSTITLFIFITDIDNIVGTYSSYSTLCLPNKANCKD